MLNTITNINHHQSSINSLNFQIKLNNPILAHELELLDKFLKNTDYELSKKILDLFIKDPILTLEDLREKFLHLKKNSPQENSTKTSSNTIPFNQNDLCHDARLFHQTLHNFIKKYNGLCELICNKILFDDVLGKFNDEKSLRNHLSIDKIDTQKIKTSHLLEIYSIFRRALAFLFGIYPDNIFSIKKQWKLVKQKSILEKTSIVDRKILQSGLKKIAIGETLKLEVFNNKGFNFEGHSLLIKKTDADAYIFFDPNSGEQRNLTSEILFDQIDNQLKVHRGTDILLIRGQTFLKRLNFKEQQ